MIPAVQQFRVDVCGKSTKVRLGKRGDLWKSSRTTTISPLPGCPYSGHNPSASPHRTTSTLCQFQDRSAFLGPRGWASLLTDIPSRHKVPAILVRLRFGHAAKETFCQTLLLK